MASAAMIQAPQAPASPCGFAALAESTWMGSMQAPGMLEPLHEARPRFRGRLTGLLTRELTIPEASFVLMASFFLSSILGAVRQVLFNAEFGAGADASAFYAAIRLPDTLFSLIAGGALSSAMIPVLLSATREEGAAAARRLTSLVLTTLLTAFAVLVLLGELITPAFVAHVLAPGFDASTSSVTSGLTRLMLIQPVILAVGSVATAVLNSRSRFLLTALSVASHNLGLIAGILATKAVPGLGIYGPALGVVAGAVLQVLILLPGLRGTAFGGALDFGDRNLRQVIALLIPNGLAVGVGYGGFILDTAFASRASPARCRRWTTPSCWSRCRSRCWGKRSANPPSRAWRQPPHQPPGSRCVPHSCGRWLVLPRWPFPRRPRLRSLAGQPSESYSSMASLEALPELSRSTSWSSTRSRCRPTWPPRC